MSVLAFLTGLGTGYITSKDKEAKQARDDEDRAMRKDEHAARMDELKRLKADRQALVDASKPIAMTEGAGGMLKPETMDNRDVGLPDMAAAPNQGLQQGAYSVAGKSFADKAAAQTELAAQNAPAAAQARRVMALQNNGDFQGALNLENAGLEQQSKRLGLQAEELKLANTKFNTELTTQLDADANWATSAAGILSKSNMGALAGVKVNAVVSADGKTVDFMGAMPDGTTQTLKSLPNSDVGKAMFLQSAMKASPEAKIEYIHGRAKEKQTQDNSDRDFKERETANKNSQSNSDRDFDLRKKDNENNQQYRLRSLGIQAAQEKRAAETHAVTMEDAKVPGAVKLRAASLADEIKGVNAAINKAMAENQFDANSPNAQALLTQRATLGIKYEKLLEPFIKNGDLKAKVDVLGLNPNAAPPAAAKPAETPPKLAAQTTPLPAPAVPPTPEETLAQFRTQVALNKQVTSALAADPRIAELNVKKTEALRRGKAVEANGFQSEMDAIKKSYQDKESQRPIAATQGIR
jgi:hypothetical protein